MKEIHTLDFEAAINDNFSFIYITATWCGPCRRLDMDFLVGLSDKIKWYECDIDENDTSLGYAGLKSIPGFCLIKDGVFKAKKAGASGTEDVLNWLRQERAPVL